MRERKRAQWTSKLGFILAAAGSAVGLGNIWKFPGKAYAGGGAAFLLIYLGIVLLIGVPVMISELSLGRYTKKNTVGIFRTLDKRFTWVGWMGVLCAFAILCYYSHVGGYVMSYIGSYITDSSTVMSEGLNYFYNFLGWNPTTEVHFIPYRALIFALIYVTINALILSKGVSSGIEKFNKYGMPALFCLLLILLGRSLTLPGGAEGLKYMLTPDWSLVTSKTFIIALGQAFYSLSLGMAIMTTYGSYLQDNVNISKNSFIICGLDTMVAFLAGFIVIPAVFATVGTEGGVGMGASFGFGALAKVFGSMPGGQIFGILFYVLLLFAAISSSISIEEGIVAFACEEWGWNRKKAIWGIAGVCYIIGIFYTISQLSVSIPVPWVDFTGVTMASFGDWLENLTDRLLLPVCALGEAIFVGWFWKPKKVFEEVTKNNAKFSWFGVYSFLIKYLCPVAIAVIILYSFITGTTVS